MRVTIIGVRTVSFTSKEGLAIRGQNVFFTEPIPAGKGYGLSAEKVFIPERLSINTSIIPVEADILFNRYGKVDEINTF